MIPLEIVHIFGGVYSIKYQGASADALTDLLDKWSDLDFIKAKYDACYDHISSDKYYEKLGIDTFDKVIDVIAKERSAIIGKLITIANDGNNTNSRLSDLFVPLGGGSGFNEDDCFFKLKPPYRKGRFLRIYAIKLVDDSFIIVGGTIKFHRKMDSPYYSECKLQLVNTKKYLVENQYLH